MGKKDAFGERKTSVSAGVWFGMILSLVVSFAKIVAKLFSLRFVDLFGHFERSHFASSWLQHRGRIYLCSQKSMDSAHKISINHGQNPWSPYCLFIGWDMDHLEFAEKNNSDTELLLGTTSFGSQSAAILHLCRKG